MRVNIEYLCTKPPYYTNKVKPGFCHSYVKANTTFATLDEVNRVATQWAEMAPNLVALTEAANQASEFRVISSLLFFL